MSIVNLTPHILNIHTADGVVDIPPSGMVARVATKSNPFTVVHGIPVVMTTYGEVEGLPDPVLGTVYVVSGMVEAAIKRHDVFAPGDMVRDADGKPVGCKGLKKTH